jgi:spore coat protein A
MKLSRRDVIRVGAMAGAGAMFLPKKFLFAQPSPSLAPFVDRLPIPPVLPRASSYTVRMTQFFQKLHRDLPATKLWGYNGTYVGPTFEARTGSPIQVEWKNNLPDRHFLPIDFSLHGAQTNKPEVRTVVHLHGHKVLGDSDGYPEAWYTHDYQETGPFFNNRIYHYPNDQAAMGLWYHDHALGITRLNVMAGLAGFYFIRDSVEDSLNLPKGRYEVPIMMQDRLFNADGSLLYPVQDPSVSPPIPPVWIPEFFGDTGLVNGKVLPFLEVEPRKYRFRLLNACNARFLHLTLVNANDSRQALIFNQIGADQGFLPHPVALPDLLMGPAERCDVVVDFRGLSGKSFILKNDAPSPFPGGGEVDCPQFMKIKVSLPLSQQDSPLPSSLASVPLISTSSASRTRRLILAEDDDPTTGDPLVGLLGTASDGTLNWDAAVTEDPRAGSTEVWELLNTTGDAHPIHVHLVRFQIVNRQQFDLNRFLATGQIQLIGPPIAPDANERPAWKDVVKAVPGDPDNGIGLISRIIHKFELPHVPVPSNNFQRYVWHCHILEHEDNEMMRPYNVRT